MTLENLRELPIPVVITNLEEVLDIPFHQVVWDNDRGILAVTVTEGRKHLVRNMSAAAGLKVHRLVRMEEGGLALGDLRTG